MIWSAQPEPRKVKVDIGDVLKNFDKLLYTFLLIGLTVVTVLLAMFINWQTLTNKHKLKLYKMRVWSKFLLKLHQCLRSVIYHIWCLLVDQEQLVTKFSTLSVLWLSVCLFIFATLTGYYLNLMSTDMVAEIPRPTLDTVEDLFTEEFEDIRVLLSNSLPAYNYIGNSETDVLKKLSQQIARNDVSDISKCSILSINSRKFDGDFLKRIHDIMQYKGSALIIEQFLMSSIPHVQCLFSTRSIELTHKSDTFGEGIITIPVDTHLNPNLKVYLDQVTKSVIEFGLKEYMFNQFEVTLFGQMALDMNTFDNIKCMNPVKEEPEKEILLKLETLNIAFKSSMISLIIAFVCHVISILRYHCSKI